MLQVSMAFRMYVELNKQISYRPIKYLNIDSNMLDANKNCFVSTYLTYYNYRHLMSNIKMNASKSAIVDAGDCP